MPYFLVLTLLKASAEDEMLCSLTYEVSVAGQTKQLVVEATWCPRIPHAQIDHAAWLDNNWAPSVDALLLASENQEQIEADIAHVMTVIFPHHAELCPGQASGAQNDAVGEA